MSGPELKPCPFCGADASAEGKMQYSKNHQAWWPDKTRVLLSFYVNCTKCGCSNQGMFGHQTKTKAIAAWNTRAALCTTDERVKELEAENARLREIIFGAGVNLWDRAELSERDENDNPTILLWHPTGVPAMVLKVHAHAPGLDKGHIHFAVADILDVFMAREIARAFLASIEGAGE